MSFNIPKVIFSLFVFLILILSGTILLMGKLDGLEKYQVFSDDLSIPEFAEIEVNFNHIYKGSRDLPFMAGAIIDVDNDGVEELFLGGGVRQADGLFQFRDDNFVNIADEVGLVKQGPDATLGAVVLDFDKNGYSDLLISRSSGVWLYRNHGGSFSSQRIEVGFHDNSFPLGIAITDLNRDGHFDMFIPSYAESSHERSRVVYNGAKYGGNSRLYLNNGDNSFFDITETAGALYTQNAQQAIFADTNEDSLEDLVVLYAGGEIRIWQNRGDLLFENKEHILSDKLGMYMGVSSGDYNNDGRLDFFISNSGSTIPNYLAKGYIHESRTLYSKWILLKNMGDLKFLDEAETTKLADYELSRGAIFVDLNLDGLNDLVVSQNHPEWPMYQLETFRLPGRVFLQNEFGKYAAVGKATGVINTGYSITPLIADFNQDGQPDIVHVNMAGPSKVFLSKRGENNFLKVKLADTLDSLGAIVTVETLSGKIMRQPFLVGKQLCSDSSHVLFFGLGDEKAIEVRVQLLNGEHKQASGEFFNTTVVLD